MSKKVFVIGLSRTGTTSISGALTILGYKTLHYPDTDDVIEKTLKARFNWNVLETHDAFSDTPVSLYFRELDKQCPGSKFILTTRDIDEWLRSCSNHIKHKMHHYNPENIDQRKLYSRIIRAGLYDRHYYNRSRFREAYYRHDEAVREYFVKRPKDLLIMDVREGWPPLCAFLGKKIPKKPFPHYSSRESYQFK